MKPFKYPYFEFDYGFYPKGFRRLAQAMGQEGCSYRKMLREEFGIDMDKFRDKNRVPGGYGDKARVQDFPLDQVRKGVEVELEHTDDPYVALEIALDHLVESDQYYDSLEEMETSLEEDKE